MNEQELDDGFVDLAYRLLSELFKPEDETTPEKVWAVRWWLVRNICKPEVDEALWRHFEEKVTCDPNPSEEVYASLEKVKRRIGMVDPTEAKNTIEEHEINHAD